MDLGRSDYSPEELDKLLAGEATLRSLGEVTNAQLAEIAETGHSMLTSGKSKEAKVIFTGLVAIEPREPYFRVMLGYAFMMEENWVRAEEVFSEAIEINPNDANAWVSRGEVRLRLGRLDDAEKDLLKVIELDPEGKAPSTHRARAIASYVVRTIQEAVAKGLPPTTPPSKPQKL